MTQPLSSVASQRRPVGPSRQRLKLPEHLTAVVNGAMPPRHSPTHAPSLMRKLHEEVVEVTSPRAIVFRSSSQRLATAVAFVPTPCNHQPRRRHQFRAVHLCLPWSAKHYGNVVTRAQRSHASGQGACMLPGSTVPDGVFKSTSASRNASSSAPSSSVSKPQSPARDSGRPFGGITGACRNTASLQSVRTPCVRFSMYT